MICLILVKSTCNNASYAKQPNKIEEKRTQRKRKRRGNKGEEKEKEGGKKRGEKRGRRREEGLEWWPRGKERTREGLEKKWLGFYKMHLSTHQHHLAH